MKLEKKIEKVRKALNVMYLEYADQNGLILEPTRALGWSHLMNYVKEQQAITAIKYEVEAYLN